MQVSPAPILPATRPLPALPLARYRLRFAALNAAPLPEFAGSAWRGGFGHALRSLACRAGVPACAACAAPADCDYARIFETPVPAGSAKLRAYKEAPHPFALAAHPSGSELRLSLFGPGNAYAPLILRALQQAGAVGIGAAGARFRLESAAAENHPGGDAWSPVHLERPPTPSAPQPPPAP